MKLARSLQLAAYVATAAASQQEAPGSRGGLRAFEKLLADTSTSFPTPGPSPYVDPGHGRWMHSWCAPVCCDDATEETCYDTDGVVQSCALIADGGCPCEEGEEKCDADIANNIPGFCAPKDFCCDTATEERCWDTLTCAPIATGGCPCEEGESKCGLDAANGDPGYCAKVCCNWETQEMCYNDAGEEESCADIASGGCPCPPGQSKCGADVANGWPGFCDTVCCDWETEEACFDTAGVATSCAPIATGGCPCPAGEARCGADLSQGWVGWCTPVCCDDSTQETCYDDSGPVSCASIADGGCPCDEGLEKCGVDPENGYAGWCTDICCADDEEMCFDENDVASCAKIADGCPCPAGEQRCTFSDNEAIEFARAMKLRQPPNKQTDAPKEDAAKLVEGKGTAKEQAYYRTLQKEKQAVRGDNHAKSLEKREAALVQAIERRVEKLQKGKQFAKKNGEVSYM